jgi:transcriptional regulator with XRE-family HTH domain
MSNQTDAASADISLADLERGQRIRQARIAANLSNGEFAKAMDLTPGSVSQWESGRTRPNRERLKRLCEILNCSPAWIEGRSQEKKATVEITQRFAPLFSLEQVGRGVPSWDASDIGPDKGVAISEPCSDAAFAVKIESQRYRPALSSGATLVIDPVLKDEIRHLDIVLAALNGRVELFQALHNAKAAVVTREMIDNPETASNVREQLLLVLADAAPDRTRLVYRHLDDPKLADARELRIIGPAVQKIEPRGWASITRATIEHARPTMAQVLQGMLEDDGALAGTPQGDDIAPGVLPSKDGA